MDPIEVKDVSPVKEKDEIIALEFICPKCKRKETCRKSGPFSCRCSANLIISEPK